MKRKKNSKFEFLNKTIKVRQNIFFACLKVNGYLFISFF